MPIPQAIRCYGQLTKDVFSVKKRFGTGTFKLSKLRGALEFIVGEAAGNNSEPMLESEQGGRSCKTYECRLIILSKENI